MTTCRYRSGNGDDGHDNDNSDSNDNDNHNADKLGSPSGIHPPMNWCRSTGRSLGPWWLWRRGSYSLTNTHMRTVYKQQSCLMYYKVRRTGPRLPPRPGMKPGDVYLRRTWLPNMEENTWKRTTRLGPITGPWWTTGYMYHTKAGR